jgi:TonB family protein
LMVAHERMHIVRGDLHANALTAALRCVFWFNPLLHLAARHFRHDQELACDLRVIARHPHARRAYGEAMLKTQLALHPLPLGCYWGSHPLKERIAMLKQPVPSLTRWIGGAALVAVLALGVGFAAWSAQPARTVASHDVPPPPPPPAPPAPPAPPMPPGPHGPPMSAPAAPPAVPAIPAAAPVAPAPPALPAPAYPKDALAQHINGKVVLLIDIDARGNPTNVVVDRSEPPGVFDQVSIDAARKWKFKPAIKDGRPVAGRISVPVQFESRGKPDPAGTTDSSAAPSARGARR